MIRPGFGLGPGAQRFGGALRADSFSLATF